MSIARSTIEASAGTFFGKTLGARNLVSGRDMPTANLPGWTNIFNDDFPVDVALGQFPVSKTAVTPVGVCEKWYAYDTGWDDTVDTGKYNALKTVTITDSVLRKRLWTEGGQPKPWVAALRPKINGPGSAGTPHPHQLYGRYAIRWRLDSVTGDGFKIAWLLWPNVGSNITGADPGPGGNGEINWPEMELQESAVGCFTHHMNATVGNDQSTGSAPIVAGQWNTHVIEWSPGMTQFFQNDVLVATHTTRVPSTSMRWIIQSETELGGGVVSTDEAVILIDWVSVWSYTP